MKLFKKKKIAIITTVKNNSRRLKNKNIKILNGKPLYMYTVEKAKEMCEKLNAKFYFIHNYDKIKLPDFVNECKHRINLDDWTYIKDCIDMFKIDADIYILLQVSSPFRNIDYNKINEFTNKNYDCGVSVTKIDKGLYYTKKPINFKQNNRFTIKHKVENVYKENGSFFIFKKKQLKKQHILNSKKKLFFYDDICIDIDTQKEFNKAKEILKKLK